MRARIVGRRFHTRGGESWVHWYATITDHSGVTLWADDCRDLAVLADQARGTVFALGRVARLGYRLKSWRRLVEKAVI